MERMAFRMRIKPGSEQEYRRRHDEIWPEMVAALRAAGFHNYSIFLDGLILFAYFESENVRETLARITADPVNARWAVMMSDILETEQDPATGFVPALPQMFYFAG